MKAVADGELPRQWATMLRTSSLDNFRRLRLSNTDSADGVLESDPPCKTDNEISKIHFNRGEGLLEQSYFRSDSSQTQFVFTELSEEQKIPHVATAVNKEVQFRKQNEDSSSIQALVTNCEHYGTRSIHTGEISDLYSPVNYEQWCSGLFSNKHVSHMNGDCLEHSMTNDCVCYPPHNSTSPTNSSAALYSLETLPYVAFPDRGNPPPPPSNSVLFHSVDNTAQREDLALSPWPLLHEGFPVDSSAQILSHGGRLFSLPTTGSVSHKNDAVYEKPTTPLQFQWTGTHTPFEEEQLLAMQSFQKMYSTSSKSCPSNFQRPNNPQFELGENETLLLKRMRGAESNTKTEMNVKNETLACDGAPVDGQGGNLVKKQRNKAGRVGALVEKSAKRERVRSWEANRRQRTSKRRTLVRSSSQDSETANNGQLSPGGPVMRGEARGRSTFAAMVRDNVIKTGPQIWTVGHDANIHVYVKPNGSIVYKESEFNSISSFALAVIRERNPYRLACDGWKDVKCDGKRLDSLREMYLYYMTP